LNNTYIEVSEGAKFDSLIINGTDTIIISKTYGYYGDIALFFRNVARIGTAGMVGTVFGSKTDNTVIDNVAHLGEVNEGSADDNIAIGLFGRQNSVQLSGERNTFLQVLVHFPVACYNVLSHCGTLFF